MNLVEYLQQLSLGDRNGDKVGRKHFESVRESKSFSEAAVRLEDACEIDPRLSERDRSDIFECGCYEIHCAPNGELQQMLTSLRTANSLGIASAPWLLDSVTFENGHGVILAYVPGLENDRLVPFIRLGELLSAEVLERFALDFELLLEAGWIHPYAVIGMEHWSVHPQTKHLMVDRWEVLMRKEECRITDTEVRDRINGLRRSAKDRA